MCSKNEGHHTSRTRGTYENNILPGRRYQYRGEMKIIKQNQIEINLELVTEIKNILQELNSKFKQVEEVRI